MFKEVCNRAKNLGVTASFQLGPDLIFQTSLHLFCFISNTLYIKTCLTVANKTTSVRAYVWDTTPVQCEYLQNFFDSYIIFYLFAASLKGIERYNPNNIETIQNYIDVQVAENGYDLEANLALLKLYQFNPNMLNIEYVCKVLLKSLASLPLSDYLLCKSLLSLEILDNEKVKSIQTMAEMLEACSFKEFWAKSRTDFANLTRAIAGFEDNMRK